MLSNLAQATFAFSLAARCLGQDRFFSEIPAAEASALAEIFEIRPFTQQVYPNLQPARLVGYEGMSPGPTIIVPMGTESVVRFVNNADRENSVHLHGSPSRAPFDGWAEDLTHPGEYKDYYYPNYQSARFLWYHDHAMHWTAENAYFGQAGAYLINDPAEDALGLPSGYGTFDIPLVLSSKYYNSDGTLKSSQGEDQSLWGDVIHVNGQPWPFLNVQPRKYRFRFLNAALSRNFDLYFVKSNALNTKIPFKVIASDAGLLTNPVQVTDLKDSPAERYEVVFDFSEYAGQTIELRNIQDAGGIGVDDEYENTDKVMKFVVSSTPATDTSNVPSTLRNVPFPPSSSGIDHHFRFHRSNSQWLINNVGFADVENRVLAKVPRGKVEIWELENSSGGWTHPIHVHLVDFRVIARNGRGVEPYEAAGLKDVVWLGKNEVVQVEAHYAPWNGVYMFHCHNLIHEDQDMMAAFNVTQLQDWGYEEVTDFGNPDDPRWSAKPFVQSDFENRSGPFTQQAITGRVEEIAREQPYSELAQVEEALQEAWADGSAEKRGVSSKAAGPIPRYRRFRI
ncbi:Cupredoxin [Lentithecium fluviatile CBS 122367]|uniref:Cupredoxin n=1 Tax=Lentithecium fluviatile CBS 122367 TaxID=1168545 RepID=A0A6G1IZJ9_9PLEO|nr:Cupredoxin [Lentithecium fluviatile CBS 122367]